jgi:dehydrogenase
LSKEGQHGMADGGGADVILATSNSYKATSDSIKGLRADGRFVLMCLNNPPFTISPEILFRRARIIGSTQNDRQHLYEALDM